MKKNRKAFSFIELILAVVIIGLLLAVSIPAVVKMRDNALYGNIAANIEKIIDAGKKYNDEHNTGNVDYKTLIENGYIKSFSAESGESYDDVVVHTVGGKIIVTTSIGKRIEKDY